MFFLGAAFAGGGAAEISPAVGYLMLIGALWSYITLWKLSNKHIIKNKVGTVIAMTVGFLYYGIFLLLAGIWTSLNKKKWKNRIAAYELGLG